MTLRPLADIRTDLEKLDADLDNLIKNGGRMVSIDAIQVRRNILAAELQAWYDSFPG